MDEVDSSHSEPQDQLPKLTPTLVASTLDTYSCTIAESLLRERKLRNAASTVDNAAEETPLSIPEGIDDPYCEVNYFKNAQWLVVPSSSLKVPTEGLLLANCIFFKYTYTNLH